MGMKKFILFLAVLMVTACGRNSGGNASHYKQPPRTDLSGVQIIEPIAEYKLGGHSIGGRRLSFYLIDDVIWYEYTYDANFGGLHPYKKVHGDVDGTELYLLAQKMLNDSTENK